MLLLRCFQRSSKPAPSSQTQTVNFSVGFVTKAGVLWVISFNAFLRPPFHLQPSPCLTLLAKALQHVLTTPLLDHSTKPFSALFLYYPALGVSHYCPLRHTAGWTQHWRYQNSLPRPILATKLIIQNAAGWIPQDKTVYNFSVQLLTWAFLFTVKISYNLPKINGPDSGSKDLPTIP